MKHIGVLGSTGSIGTQTLDVIDQFRDDFCVTLLTAHSNWELLLRQVEKYQPKYVVLTDSFAYEQFIKHNKDHRLVVREGVIGVLQCLEQHPYDFIVGAMGGAAGIEPTLKALELGIDVGLANKETIVSAGDLVRKIQQKTGSNVLPIDSEHSAIFQCMEPKTTCVEQILLTASGGPFRLATLEELRRVTPEQALKHPNWSMGRKITVDSATLMNKGLEVIEANWLFGVSYDKIKVLVHPQSIVHSMVEYQDGSILAHLGMADMRIPIQYALTYPQRRGNGFPKLDFSKLQGLEFFEPDFEKFLSLSLAYEAGKIGQSMPAVLNAVNEVAVEAFLKGELSFLGIPKLVEQVMERHQVEQITALPQLLELDDWARNEARYWIKQKFRA